MSQDCPIWFETADYHYYYYIRGERVCHSYEWMVTAGEYRRQLLKTITEWATHFLPFQTQYWRCGWSINQSIHRYTKLKCCLKYQSKYCPADLSTYQVRERLRVVVVNIVSLCIRSWFNEIELLSEQFLKQWCNFDSPSKSYECSAIIIIRVTYQATTTIGNR